MIGGAGCPDVLPSGGDRPGARAGSYRARLQRIGKGKFAGWAGYALDRVVDGGDHVLILTRGIVSEVFDTPLVYACRPFGTRSWFTGTLICRCDAFWPVEPGQPISTK